MDSAGIGANVFGKSAVTPSNMSMEAGATLNAKTALMLVSQRTNPPTFTEFSGSATGDSADVSGIFEDPQIAAFNGSSGDGEIDLFGGLGSAESAFLNDLSDWPGIDPKIAKAIKKSQFELHLATEEFKKQDELNEARNRVENEIAWAKDRVRRKKFMLKLMVDELRQLQNAMHMMSLMGMRIPNAMLKRSKALEAMIGRLKNQLGSDEVLLASKQSQMPDTLSSATSVGSDGTASASSESSAGGDSGNGGSDLGSAMGGEGML